MPSHSFTRTELHQLIWSKPLNKLAAELGLSDVGLKKLCKRHDIPTPPQGHWISLHHGKSRPIIPLPPKPEDDDPHFRIGFAATLTPKAARAEIAEPVCCPSMRWGSYRLTKRRNMSVVTASICPVDHESCSAGR